MKSKERKGNRFLSKIITVLIGGSMMASCSINIAHEEGHSHEIDEEYISEEGNLTAPIDIATHQEDKGPSDPYNEGIVLVKTFNEIDAKSLGIEVKSINELYPNSPWKSIEVSGISTKDAVRHLRSLGIFDAVDYDYKMDSAVEIESIDVSSNPYADSLPYIESNGIGHAWGWGRNKHKEDENEPDAGGSPDVVVAVIDTGVDYNHVDLRDNIWTNTGEIPNNGVDDDGNGYVDDVRGWDCVNEDNNPIDDNGHGTHVSGIIAAENNNIGTVGVAFNCKVMPVKAGNSSGSFTNADIAQAIQYAYMNGASVINMSFGGASISLATEDALADAYSQCVLVAAAGNNGTCDQPGCPYCQEPLPFYPGSIPYVVGVMSCDDDGSYISGFSNYDHAPFHYNHFEYDCFACGEEIASTWPNNKYARLSGTSMASPVVAGIAALLRSAYPDRETYSNKYIHSQLSNTGPTGTYTRIGNGLTPDGYHPLCNAYDALTKIPKPSIHSLYDYYIFDNTDISPNNNGDGFIDAGETIRLGIELQNRGGKASNVTATIDTIRNGDPNLIDPNIIITEDTIHMDNIGTYSIQDGGKIYDGNKVVNMTNAFEIEVNPSTPNGYYCAINLHIEYYNGLEDDGIKYTGECAFTITVSSGMRLSGTITEDTVFTADKSYVITDSLVIAADTTVTFEEGCKISFYSDSMGYIDSTINSPVIDVFGTLLFEGSAENMIDLSVNPIWDNYHYFINARTDTALIEFEYAKIDRALFNRNYRMENINIRHCHLTYDKSSDVWVPFLKDGQGQGSATPNTNYITNLEDSFVDLRRGSALTMIIQNCKGCTFLLGNNYVPYFDLNISYSGGVYRDNLFITSDQESITGFQGAPGTINWNGTEYDNETPSTLTNNAIISDFVPNSVSDLAKFNVDGGNTYTSNTSDNYFSKEYRDYSNSLLTNNFDSAGHPIVDPNDEGNHDDSLIWPYIKDITILNSNDEVVHTVGTEKNKVRVTFSRDMDTTNDFSLRYGSWYPYSDYAIQGDYVSDSVWEGEFQVKANIEGGKQFFSSTGGCAKDDSFKTLMDNAGAFTFNIDTASAFSMNLQASTSENGVELTWVQDDYDTLMGYNIYRSEEKDGNYARINPSIIPAGENTFLDDSCEPGHTYWYTFTVVLSDFSESAPAGKVSATAVDTISPTIYHTPVNQGYEGNNLAINCSVSDNIAVTGVTLYYRTVGEVNWKSLSMTKANDRYSATIFGSEVTSAGIEYYISATDGRNVVTRGSAESPFSVIIKDPSLLNNLGDVDGDGTITTKDALMIIRTIGGELILTDDQFQRADLNKDSKLSTCEALRILQYVNGNVTTVDMSN